MTPVLRPWQCNLLCLVWGDWLKIVPSPSLGMHLHDRELRIRLAYWLGLCLMEHETSCPCCTNRKRWTLWATTSLNAVGTVTAPIDMMSSETSFFPVPNILTALAPRKVLPALIPGSVSHPADVFLPNWCRGHPAAPDVTVISTMQEHTVTGAATTQGHALRIGE